MSKIKLTGQPKFHPSSPVSSIRAFYKLLLRKAEMAQVTSACFHMFTILHHGRFYLAQSIVWVSYKGKTLSIGFADGMTIEIEGREASHQRKLLEDALSIKLRD
jgi:hypothetical protein